MNGGLSRAERLAILGPEAVAMAHEVARQSPPPDREQIEALRRIFSGSGRNRPLSNAA